VVSECPSAFHGTSRDPYGCYERERSLAARLEAKPAERPTYPRGDGGPSVREFRESKGEI
jgi:hypothetical protein